MTPAPLPANEAERLSALRDFEVLDTPPERAFDELALLAAQVCHRPMALVSLVDSDRQWCKARRGFPAAETPRDDSFCAHALMNPEEVMIVPDARRDERFCDNPLVAGRPHLRFYAGAPLLTAGGQALGTLCVLDTEPGEMSEAQIDALQTLARQVMAQLELRSGEAARLRAALDESERRLRMLEEDLARRKDALRTLPVEHSFRRAVLDRAAEGVCVCHTIPDHPFVQFTVWNSRMTEITGYSMDEINRKGWYQSLYPDPEVQRRAIERMHRMRVGEDLRYERWEITRADGHKRVLGISTSLLVSADGSEQVLGMMHDLTEEELLAREVRRGRRDDLTGLKNPRAFKEDAATLLKLSRRMRAPCALAFLDLDDFKSVNDAQGHAEGDRLLALVGATLLESTRSTDPAGRLGGDEFALLLPNTDAGGAKLFFDRLHQRVAGAMRQRGFTVGLSIGVALFPLPPSDLGVALGHADRLMYQAKRSGKNQVVYVEC
jgi:diguanylate cyclase (GGDEF)-like protein/PAS domain S-box-containing protein